MENFYVQILLLYIMLQVELLDEARSIAYSETAKPKDQIAALAELYANRADTAKVVQHLEDAVLHGNLTDTLCIKAIALLRKIRADIGAGETQTAVDAQEIRQDLLRQFVNGTAT